MFSVAVFGLHRMRKFSVRHSQPFFVVFEWCAALLSIVHLSGRNDPHTCWTISAIVSCAPEIFQISLTGFKLMISVMAVQCSNQVSYEATQM